MFIVMLAQLERQPLKKKAFCKWLCSYKCSSCVSQGFGFFSFSCSFIILSLRKYKVFCGFCE